MFTVNQEISQNFQRGIVMKEYQLLQVVITFLEENDVVTFSGPGQFEGVTDLDPSKNPDWFGQ